MRFPRRRDQAVDRPKVFCIGRNKTGTTSLAAALEQHGYRVAPQGPAELQLRAWADRDFSELLAFTEKFDAFQDVPFSCPWTYVALDQRWPGARFVLSVRHDEHVWFDSLVTFQSKVFGEGQLPTPRELQQATYRYEGYVWDMHQLIYGADAGTLFDPEQYKRHYLDHNQAVREYFAHRPHDLLELDVSEPGAYQRLGAFVGFDVAPDASFPWQNASATAGIDHPLHPRNRAAAQQASGAEQ